jgi:hypothetical protein
MLIYCFSPVTVRLGASFICIPFVLFYVYVEGRAGNRLEYILTDWVIYTRKEGELGRLRIELNCSSFLRDRASLRALIFTQYNPASIQLTISPFVLKQLIYKWYHLLTHCFHVVHPRPKKKKKNFPHG